MRALSRYGAIYRAVEQMASGRTNGANLASILRYKTHWLKGETGMALTTTREEIEQALARMEQSPTVEGRDELTRRLDALVEAVEILARDKYEFPGLPESRLRGALTRARRA
jgi:hypothetical protein